MQYRTLSTPPGVVLGYRKNGRPIHPIAGGSEPTVETPPAPDPAPEPAAPPTAEPPKPESPSAEPGADKSDRVIAAIREDFKGERTKRQEAEQRLTALQAGLDADKAERAKRDKALAVALGLASDEEPPDPVKLAADLKAAQEQARSDIAQRDTTLRQQQVELAVLRNAAKHGAVGDALLDSRSFMTQVGSLDPAAGDFAERLGEAIKTAAEANPQYKAAKAAPEPKAPPSVARSGGEFNGAPGGNRQWNLDDVQRASASDVVAAQDAGLLIDLGYAPRKKAR